ncbi:MAG: hypothetical protein OXE77_00110 [Flavobacteriaceae bacterium]|nr:hypothetical protein [Flavobacteriaceae bacterium]MCY4267003.1 hypothetical protein [Flavobacteriaceae bacterium]
MVILFYIARKGLIFAFGVLLFGEVIYSQTTHIETLEKECNISFCIGYYRITGTYEGIGKQVFILATAQRPNKYQELNVDKSFESINTIVRGYIDYINDIDKIGGIVSKEVKLITLINMVGDPNEFYQKTSIVRIGNLLERSFVNLHFDRGLFDLNKSILLKT